jgi:glutamate N-acetyltransferase/amino-acid N-acetyltransferase
VAEHALVDALTIVCGSLAEQMARDAEGATKLVRVRVVGARTHAEARIAARAVANSQLVQCSLNGGDAYWGRILSELGASGAFIDPEQVDIAYNGVTVCRDGIACAHDEAALAKQMAAREIELRCDLHQAHGEATVLTTDLSHAYIDENRQTS